MTGDSTGNCSEAQAPLGCSLDAIQLRSQRDRYAAIAPGVVHARRSATAIAWSLSGDVDPKLVEETVAVERRCCPFFTLAWDPRRRVLRVAVEDPEHAPALDALAEVLGGA